MIEATCGECGHPRWDHRDTAGGCIMTVHGGRCDCREYVPWKLGAAC